MGTERLVFQELNFRTDFKRARQYVDSEIFSFKVLRLMGRSLSLTC